MVPQTIACQTGVLVVNLLMWLWSHGCSMRLPFLSFYTSMLIFIIRAHWMHNVVVISVVPQTIKLTQGKTISSDVRDPRRQ